MNETNQNQGKKNEPQVVASFAKNKREEVRVHLSEWEGSPYVDIRVFLLTRDGDWVRTRKGLMVNADLLPDLAASIEKAGAELSLVDNG